MNVVPQKSIQFYSLVFFSVTQIGGCASLLKETGILLDHDFRKVCTSFDFVPVKYTLRLRHSKTYVLISVS
jgi:hypothetical protein